MLQLVRLARKSAEHSFVHTYNEEAGGEREHDANIFLHVSLHPLEEIVKDHLLLAVRQFLGILDQHDKLPPTQPYYVVELGKVNGLSEHVRFCQQGLAQAPPDFFGQSFNELDIR